MVNRQYCLELIKLQLYIIVPTYESVVIIVVWSDCATLLCHDIIVLTIRGMQIHHISGKISQYISHAENVHLNILYLYSMDSISVSTFVTMTMNICAI